MQFELITALIISWILTGTVLFIGYALFIYHQKFIYPKLDRIERLCEKRRKPLTGGGKILKAGADPREIAMAILEETQKQRPNGKDEPDKETLLKIKDELNATY
jgi:hypothetical protein